MNSMNHCVPLGITKTNITMDLTKKKSQTHPNDYRQQLVNIRESFPSYTPINFTKSILWLVEKTLKITGTKLSTLHTRVTHKFVRWRSFLNSIRTLYFSVDPY